MLGLEKTLRRKAYLQPSRASLTRECAAHRVPTALVGQESGSIGSNKQDL